MNNILRFEKRIRFIIVTAALSVTLLISTFFFFDKAWLFIPLLIILAYGAVYFSIIEGIEKIEWMTLFIMPVLLTVSLYLFYFLFPVRWLTRIPFIIFYAVSFYAMLLVSNIFNVGVEKSLQLYRAAFSVNYFYQTIIIFLGSNIILSLKLSFLEHLVIFFVFISAMAIHLFWSIKLDWHFEKQVIQLGLLVGFIIAQIATVASFVPLQTSVFALLITASYYGMGGLSYLHLDQRLFKETIREYVFVIVFVAAIVIFTINW